MMRKNNSLLSVNFGSPAATAHDNPFAPLKFVSNPASPAATPGVLSIEKRCEFEH